jgi:hypothetical protein
VTPELVGRLVELGILVEQVSLPHGGQPVKWLGDGVMFHPVPLHRAARQDRSR